MGKTLKHSKSWIEEFDVELDRHLHETKKTNHDERRFRKLVDPDINEETIVQQLVSETARR